MNWLSWVLVALLLLFCGYQIILFCIELYKRFKNRRSKKVDSDVNLINNSEDKK